MMRKRIPILFLLITLFSTTMMAQLGIPSVKNEDYKNSIELSNLNINIDVVGNVATTTFDMVFYNNSHKTLEGEFEFPLDEGQTCSRYALDINGKLREGVVVEKEKGRKAFEEKVRENVDPGLLEMTEGNNFRTRIYPFTSGGTRHIVVACEQELLTSNGKRYYRLPIENRSKVKNLSITINAFNESQKPILDDKSVRELDFNQNSRNKGYTAQMTRHDYVLNKGIFFELPSLSSKPSVYKENEGSDTYFYLYSMMKPVSIKKPKSKSLAVVYDVSGSSANRNIAKDYEVLQAYIDSLGLDKIHLITFAHKQLVDTVCGISYMKRIVSSTTPKFDGGTQLGCVDLSKINEDEILLFTDGLSNIGKETLSSTKSPLYIINSNPVADHSSLKLVAMNNGGSYINLCNYNVKEAINTLSYLQYNFIQSKYNPNEITEVYPSRTTSVKESFTVSGIMKSREADITLYFGFGNNITDSVVCHISMDNSTYANNVKRMWAQKKLAELDLYYKKNEKEITDLSKKFGVVTRYTSLIVLETVEDYIRFEITPPDELKEEYYRRVPSKKQKTDDSKTKTDDVIKVDYSIISNRESFLNWWEITPEERSLAAEEKAERDRRAVQEREERDRRAAQEREEREAQDRRTLAQYHDRTIKGVVRDAREPLPFANVIIKGTNIGTITDMDGNYEIEVPLGSILEFSFAGYETITRKITNKTPCDLNVTLSEEMLEELVVVGYGVSGGSNVGGTTASTSGLFSRNRSTATEHRSNSEPYPDMEGEPEETSTIQLQYWSPDVPYLTELKSVSASKKYEAYLEMKPQYSGSPSFYLDISEYFFHENMVDEAIRVLSNLAEMKLDDAEVARSCGNKLVEFKAYDLAVSVFERVIKMRGEEPQSYRDLALAYWATGEYQKAADLLYKVGTTVWDRRFRNIQQIAINEMNAIIELNPGKVDTSKYDKRLLGNCPVDMRIILTWNTNDCDMDLWVTDPSGEKCYYGNRNTAIGGRMSDDITGGYGPEEFCIKDAIEGDYKIQANYFGTRSQKQLQPVVIQATVYTNFGKPNQKREILTLQAGSTKEVLTIGTVNFKKNAEK